MKKHFVLLLALAAVVALSSCKKVDKVLPKKTGDWKAVSGSVSTFVDGVAVTTDSTFTPSEDVIYHFDDDGTGTYTEGSAASDAFTWTYSKDPETLSITQDGVTIDYDILECTKKEMTWFFPFEIEFFGITTRTETTFNVERQD